MGVLVMGIGGVLAIFMAAASTHRGALDETAAAIVAEGAIAEFRAAFIRYPDSEPDPESRLVPAPAFPLCSYQVRATVLERYPKSARSVQAYVEVAVIWQRKGQQREEVYKTILFRE